jgi:hypothetical protein
MPNKLRRAKTFAVGRRAAGKSWRVKAVSVIEVAWEKKGVLETEAAWVTRAVWARRVASATEVDWGTKAVWGIEVV